MATSTFTQLLKSDVWSLIWSKVNSCCRACAEVWPWRKGHYCPRTVGGASCGVVSPGPASSTLYDCQQSVVCVLWQIVTDYKQIYSLAVWCHYYFQLCYAANSSWHNDRSFEVLLNYSRLWDHPVFTHWDSQFYFMFCFWFWFCFVIKSKLLTAVKVFGLLLQCCLNC